MSLSPFPTHCFPLVLSYIVSIHDPPRNCLHISKDIYHTFAVPSRWLRLVCQPLRCPFADLRLLQLSLPPKIVNSHPIKTIQDVNITIQCLATDRALVMLGLNREGPVTLKWRMEKSTSRVRMLNFSIPVNISQKVMAKLDCDIPGYGLLGPIF